MKKLLILILFAAATGTLLAQAKWEAAYLDGTWDDEAVAGMELPDNQLLFHFAAQHLPGDDFRKYTMLLGEKGELLALDTAAQLLQSFTGPYFFPASGFKARMLGYWVVPDTNRLFNVVIDQDLQHLWQGYVEVPFAGYTLMEGDSNIVVARDNDCGLQFFKAKIDGTVYWQHAFEETDLGNCAGYVSTVSMFGTPDGGYMAGMIFRDFFPDTYYIYMVKLDAEGNVEWKLRQQTEALLSPSMAYSGGYYYVHQNNQLLKIDPAGNLVSTKNLAAATGSPLATGHLVRHLVATADGQLVLTGKTPFNNTNKGNAFLAKIDTSAQLLWYKDLGRNNAPEEGQRVRQLADGGFLVTGKRFAGTLADSPGDAYFVRTDSEGNSATAQVRGRVFLDENANCLPDPGEPGIAGIQLRSSVNGLANYQTSNTSGDFAFDVREGIATLEMAEGNPYLKPCWTSSVFLVEQFDTFTLNFPIKPTAICPLLRVAMASQPFYPCEPNSYLVGYHNEGLATATGATVQVRLAPGLEDGAPSLPFTEPAPGLFEVSLGDLPPGASGHFSVGFTVPCGAEVGPFLCSEASIAPHEYCSDDPALLGDPPHFSTDCKIVAAFPPNTIGLIPTTGTLTRIGRDSTLAYLIYFQNNTGGPIANLDIRDTLASTMLPMTASFENSSHPCSFELLEGNAVRIAFENINLPDSLADPVGSKGFVQFRVEQKPSLNRNTEIKNRATLRIGNEPPLASNLVVQKVDFPDFYFPFDTTICAGQKIFGVKVFTDSVLYKTYLRPTMDSVVVAQVTVDGAVVNRYDTVTVGTAFMGAYPASDTSFLTVYPLPNGCDSTIVTYVAVLSSNREIEGFPGKLILAPNPAHDRASLLFDLPRPMAMSIEVWNAMGTRQDEWAWPAFRLPSGPSQLQLSLKNWPDGLYFLVVKTEETAKVLKLVKNGGG